MKYIISTLIIFTLNLSYSQGNKHFLQELNENLLKEINCQGYLNFKKSKFYKNKINYFVYPSFWVEMDCDFEKINFLEKDNILKNLYFQRKTKRKLEKSINWTVLDIIDKNLFHSDFKLFYKEPYNDEIEKTGLDNKKIKFSFKIQYFSANIIFYITTTNEILTYDQKNEKWMSLEEFDKELKGKKYFYERL